MKKLKHRLIKITRGRKDTPKVQHERREFFRTFKLDKWDRDFHREEEHAGRSVESEDSTSDGGVVFESDKVWVGMVYYDVMW